MTLMIRLILPITLSFAATVAPAESPRASLTINEEPVAAVVRGVDVRRALQRCRVADSCASVILETWDRCYLAAEVRGDGFEISSRLGPPGPLYELYDTRGNKADAAIFSAAEMIEIFAGYLEDRRPTHVGYRDTNQI